MAVTNRIIQSKTDITSFVSKRSTLADVSLGWRQTQKVRPRLRRRFYCRSRAKSLESYIQVLSLDISLLYNCVSDTRVEVQSRVTPRFVCASAESPSLRRRLLSLAGILSNAHEIDDRPQSFHFMLHGNAYLHCVLRNPEKVLSPMTDTAKFHFHSFYTVIK